MRPLVKNWLLFCVSLSAAAISRQLSTDCAAFVS
jgi:hypothetical protein